MSDIKIKKNVKVKEGDCISSLAAEYGFLDWRSLYDNQETDFQDLRKNPNALNPGDVVRIPDDKRLEEDKTTGKTHSFTVVKPKPVHLRIVIIDYHEKPIMNKGYKLTPSLGTLNGTSDGKGLIDCEVSVTLRNAELEMDLSQPPRPIPVPGLPPAVPDPTPYPPKIDPADFKIHPDTTKKKDYIIQWKLALGSLGSANTEKGASDRLHNLGFLILGGNTMSTQVKAYQRRNSMDESGDLADIETSIEDKHDKI